MSEQIQEMPLELAVSAEGPKKKITNQGAIIKSIRALGINARPDDLV
jgi:hypothetical protein